MKVFNHQHNNAAHSSETAPPPEQISLRNTNFYRPTKNPQNLRVLAPPNKSFRKRPANSLLSVMSEQVMTKLLPLLEPMTLTAEQYLYRAGDPVNYLYFPESAIISEFRIIEDGRMVETALVGGEGLVGLGAFFSGAPAGSWTQVLVGGSALKIRADILGGEFDASRELQTGLLHYLMCYINQISQRSICHNYHSVEQRFCNWLLMLSRRNDQLTIPLTHELVARSLGVHRPSVSKIAKDLQDQGVIECHRGKITILDFHGVESTACECRRRIDS